MEQGGREAAALSTSPVSFHAGCQPRGAAPRATGLERSRSRPSRVSRCPRAAQLHQPLCVSSRRSCWLWGGVVRRKQWVDRAGMAAVGSAVTGTMALSRLPGQLRPHAAEEGEASGGLGFPQGRRVVPAWRDVASSILGLSGTALFTWSLSQTLPATSWSPRPTRVPGHGLAVAGSWQLPCRDWGQAGHPPHPDGILLANAGATAGARREQLRRRVLGTAKST